MKRFAALAGATLGLALAAMWFRALQREIEALEASEAVLSVPDEVYPWWEGPMPQSWTQ